MANSLEHVVVDAVAFFRNVQLQDIAKHVHTLQSVVSEIRDKATRQRLAVLPYELKLREPSTECIQIVSDFARKTGDYPSLSAVDIRVIALAYQLTKEYIGTDHLKKEPEKKVTYFATKKPLENVRDIAGFYYPSRKGEIIGAVPKNEEPGPQSRDDTEDVQLVLSEFETTMTIDGGDGQESTPAKETKEEDGRAGESAEEERDRTMGGEVQQTSDEGKVEKMSASIQDAEGDTSLAHPDVGEAGSQGKDEEEKVVVVVSDEDGTAPKNQEEDICDDDDEEEEKEDGDDDNDSDDIGWIKPSNISQLQQKMGGKDEVDLEDMKVGCMTTDFAMQNVLIQMGIPVISLNGMLIRRAKSFVFRCHDCFKITHDMSKVFCPKCGNRSLDKVTVTIDEDGTQRCHMSRRRPPNTRGLRYTLPKPQGGKHASNPILCADQQVPHNRESRKARLKTDVFNPDYEAWNSPFAAHDVTSRSAQLGVRQIGSRGPGSRRNPNENRRQTKGKRK